MQTQGEAAEIVLEDTLGAAFPIDGFVPGVKGVSGASVRQDVLGQTVSGCEVAIITSHAFPEEGGQLSYTPRLSNWHAIQTTYRCDC